VIVPPLVTVAVLAGAALHAAWNVGIRGGADRRASTAALLCGAVLISTLTLPFLAGVDSVAWRHLAVSMVLHVLYFTAI
jgi:hypothetical protein